MVLKIKYYGLIADKIGQSIDELLVSNPTERVNIRTILQQRYPILNGLTYKIAVDTEIKEEINNINSSVNIAVLPPFAGG